MVKKAKNSFVRTAENNFLCLAPNKRSLGKKSELQKWSENTNNKEGGRREKWWERQGERGERMEGRERKRRRKRREIMEGREER